MSESPHSSDSAPAYQVLARKYRPSTFEDMIGQDAMVTTLKNAFASGRVAHAFMMTGVRGIGKTTTARLLARALNYESDTLNGPSVELAERGTHCELIMASNHMDVLEMDAASRTGVENMREMLDGVRYAPATARYKVYIIDEVHMLSTGAFNALLKTLEEPPDHAKFIFATTEIRKVPITVLSRCQRFDLRRVDASVLAKHLRGICDKENVAISDEGLAMIARAAEGSVRDGLSLLDQAIVQAGLGGEEVTGEQVRVMLGLADRVRVLDLFDVSASGDSKAALTQMRAQYDDGAEPSVVIRDLLDICHDISRAKTLGVDADFDVAPDQAARMRDMGESFSTGQLTRFWQILMAAHDEVRLAPVPLAAAEMALLKLSLAGQMPPPELAAQIITQAQALAASGDAGLPHMSGGGAAQARLENHTENSLGNGGSHGANPTISPSTQTMSSPDGGSSALTAPKSVMSAAPATVLIKSLRDFTEALPAHKVMLKSDIERYVRVVSFKQGSLEINITEDRKKPSLMGQIVQAFSDMTGELWVVSPSDETGEPPLREQARQKQTQQDNEDRAHPAFGHSLISKAKLLDIYDRAENVIRGDFSQNDIGED
ncbi:MAG: DNA polymerase III subunit gamma/tau [Litorimonas sp.]